MKRGGSFQRKTPLTSRTQLRRFPLAAGCSLSRTGPLPKTSAKRRSQTSAYSALRREFLESRPVCEFPLGCGQQATEVQHRRGRRGERLNDTAWWAASCHAHNAWAEDHTGEALACGWLVRIEAVA